VYARVKRTKFMGKVIRLNQNQRYEIELFQWLKNWLPGQDRKTQQIIIKRMGAERLQRFRAWDKSQKREAV
jgi:hypothetical protein